MSIPQNWNFLKPLAPRAVKSSKTCKSFWWLRSGRGAVIHLPFRNEELKRIGHNMRMLLDTKGSVFGSQQWLWFNIWFILKLYYKIWQMLLQNLKSYIITKCDSFITKWESSYKIRPFYHKMRQLLQNLTFTTKCVGANCNKVKLEVTVIRSDIKPTSEMKLTFNQIRICRGW